MRAALGLLAGAGSSAASAQLAPPIFGNGSTTADPSADAISRASTDYRALVCVYLYGGNDGFNMLVPSNGAFYSQYAQARGGLAVPQSELLSLNSMACIRAHPNCAPCTTRADWPWSTMSAPFWHPRAKRITWPSATCHRRCFRISTNPSRVCPAAPMRSRDLAGADSSAHS